MIFTESIIVSLFSRADKFAAYYGLSLINNKQRKNATLYMHANIKLRPGTIVYLYLLICYRIRPYIKYCQHKSKVDTKTVDEGSNCCCKIAFACSKPSIHDIFKGSNIYKIQTGALSKNIYDDPMKVNPRKYDSRLSPPMYFIQPPFSKLVNLIIPVMFIQLPIMIQTSILLIKG
jgi:hypothetical protein